MPHHERFRAGHGSPSTRRGSRELNGLSVGYVDHNTEPLTTDSIYGFKIK